MIAPADADSCVAVGAVNIEGEVAGFSSYGPTSDGRTKPEVCARGVDTWCAVPGDGGDDYTDANGTSLATPLAGGVAALLMEAHPEWTAMQVREAMMMTADNADTPDNHRGWGIIQAFDAYNYQVVGIELAEAPPRPLLMRTSPNPLARAGAIDLSVPGDRDAAVTIRIYDVAGRLRDTVLDGRLAPGTHRIDWAARDAAGQPLPPGVYFLRAAVDREVAVSRVVVTP
jgi:subtilisin family serine protease